jgi:cytochrome P450
MRGFLQWLFRLRFSSRLKSFAGIPGPKPIYPLGTVGDLYGADPWDVFADYGVKYGPLSVAWLGGHPAVILNDPALIRTVLVENKDDYYKDYPIRALGPVLRNTLFNLNRPEWDPLRVDHPLAFQAFRNWLPSQFLVVKTVVDRHLDALLQERGDVEAIDKMQRLLFDVFNACTCGPDFKDGGFENFYILSEMATFRMAVPQCLLPPPLSPRFHRAMKIHYGSYEVAVKQARANPDPQRNDLLHVFLRFGTKISDSQLVDFLSEFQAGGDISCAAAIVNTLQLLNQHPAIASRLYADLADLAHRKPNYGLADLEQVSLLDHVLRESLRVIPPVALTSRNVKRDRSTVLGGYTIPPNTEVMIAMKHVQRSANHWQDPNTFNPDRWANGGVEANPIGSDYFYPFGRGPRMCAGWEFAMFCMKIILGVMLTRTAVVTSGSFKGIFHCGVVEPKKLRAKFTKQANS